MTKKKQVTEKDQTQTEQMTKIKNGKIVKDKNVWREMIKKQ